MVREEGKEEEEGEKEEEEEQEEDEENGERRFNKYAYIQACVWGGGDSDIP